MTDPITTGATWTERAAQLADLLAERGDLRDDSWWSAIAGVPRHELVPVFYEQDPQNGAWRRIDGGSVEGLDVLYPPGLRSRRWRTAAATSCRCPPVRSRT